MTGRLRMTVVGTVAAALSLLPLLELTASSDWILRAALAVLLVTATGLVARRLRAPVIITVVAQLVVVGWWLGLLIAADVAIGGLLPSAAWPDRFVAVFTEGTETINAFATPIPVTTGILAFLVAGAGAVAILVDVAAAGLRRAVFAGIPIATGYTVSAAVEGGDLAWWWFVAPAAGFLALLVNDNRVRVSTWSNAAGGAVSGATTGSAGGGATRRSADTEVLARNGRRVGVMAVATAVAVPALVPMLSDGLVNGRGGGAGGDGRTIRTDNPILDLQRNLNRPDNVDVLRYAASDTEPHYIRMVTLDSFDGEVWQTSDRPVPESQRVTEGMPDPPGLDIDDSPEVDFEFEIADHYSSRWLPLAYPAQEIEIEGDWRFDHDTLDVVSTDDDLLGSEYTATSLDVTADVTALQEAGEPDSDVEAMTDLPGDLPEMVTLLADEVTADAEDDFSKAAALQEWFRGPEFTYDISIQSGTSASAVEDFLNDRRGYCEQFAATMAMMARHLDIPARVAVGFTPGTFQGDGTYLIRTHDAHAWPELYFEGAGWTRFEPTPAGRTGTPPSWTVQPPQAPSEPGTPEPTRTSSSDPTDTPDTRPDHDRDDDAGAGATGATPTWPLTALAVAAGAAALACVPQAIALLLRTKRWGRAGADPGALAEVAWARLSETVRDAGLPWDPAATPRSAGRALAAGGQLDDDLTGRLHDLVGTVERARYARRAGSTETLRHDTETFCARVLRTRPRRSRWLAFLWPSALSDAWSRGISRILTGLDRMETAGTRVRGWEHRIAARLRPARHRVTDGD